MNIVESLGEACYPIYERLDLDKLNASVDELFSRIGLTRESFLDRMKNDRMNPAATTINLTHIPGLTGNDRWNRYGGNHERLAALGIDERDFTVRLSELDGLYLNEVIDDTVRRHKEKFGGEFSGRYQLIASNTGFGYRIHRDIHTIHRYHIPLQTDEYFMWAFETEPRQIQLLHMPADGRIWYLNARDYRHTILHMGRNPRIHLFLTS